MFFRLQYTKRIFSTREFEVANSIAYSLKLRGAIAARISIHVEGFQDEHDIVNKSLPFKLCPSANNRETHDIRAWQ